ncbi:MAG: ABC transporter substrate-binding protein [Pseudomonadota bacterium]|jgi:branched-chain amino acid transport system substrate-binding protein|nr:ABC transporter substrate-binding protein [Pseudomonadota bacterium]NLX31085.1 ABC transporter substrate-binding protein [Deltaproteobacteria bacterium]HNU85203.1 ABC transporter substrate-binding protein [Syntrophales bacterium]HNZ34486.1 ABC transporter substrate-binding protein [Syntrophales bacterium]HOF73354.1 ABC transporter substrate-binding protein [Syntrophales bacterium]
MKGSISKTMTGLLAAALLAMPATSPAAAPVKVGAAINLTGPASTWGQYHAKGTQDYLRYVNEVKGGVGGRTVDLILVDTGYKVPEAVAAVKKFAIQDRVDMILTWGAGEGLAAKPLVQGYKIPTINYSTSWELLEKPVDYMYLPFGSYRLDCAAILEYIKSIHKGSDPPKVGLLTYNNAYGRSIHKPSQEYAKANGINIVSIEEFPPRTVDLTTELLRLKKNGAEYVFMQMLPATIVTTFKSADRIQYSPQFFGTWTSTDPDFFKLGKGLIRDRLKMQFPGGLPGDKGAGVETLKELWKRYKTVTRFDTAYWEGVVVGMIVERAALRAQQKHGKVDRDTINRAMETFANEDFGGILPPVTYTKTSHEASFRGRIVQVREDGSFRPLTDFYTPGKEKIRHLK